MIPIFKEKKNFNQEMLFKIVGTAQNVTEFMVRMELLLILIFSRYESSVTLLQKHRLGSPATESTLARVVGRGYWTVKYTGT